MTILCIHTCRSVFRWPSINKYLTKELKLKRAINVIKKQSPWNWLSNVENCIREHKNVDVYVLEISTLKYDRHASNFNRREYENFLQNLMKLMKKKPVFLLFNLNPVILSEHRDPRMKHKYNNKNKIIARDNLERWSIAIFKKKYGGKYKALTGDNIFGKYNVSKFIMSQKKGLDTTRHYAGLDTRHYSRVSVDFLDNGKPVSPGTHSNRVATDLLKKFILNIVNG